MLEVAIEDLRGLALAREGGAGRVELCAALEVGGVTPSAGVIHQICGQGLPVHALIRPRAGDFVYDTAEVAVVTADCIAAIEAGAQGLVIGAGDRHGLDRAVLAHWIAAAREAADARDQKVSLTLHRVFDLLDDPVAGLDMAISLGFDRILTSGGMARAGDAVARFADLAEYAAGRITLLAGGGLVPEAIAALRAVGVQEFHASCRMARQETVDERLLELGFSAGPPRETDIDRIAQYVAEAR